MKKLTQTDKLDVLTSTEQEATKGGILLYCEEKRVKVFGKEMTTMQWKIANDGSFLLTVKM